SATTSPSEVAEQMTADIQTGYANQYDVLDGRDFDQAQKYMDKSREQMREGAKQERILDALGRGGAYLTRAEEIYEPRRPAFEGILTARRAALDAGARNFPAQRERLMNIDDDTRDAVERKGGISSQKFSELQSRYMGLELAAIQ